MKRLVCATAVALAFASAAVAQQRRSPDEVVTYKKIGKVFTEKEFADFAKTAPERLGEQC